MSILPWNINPETSALLVIDMQNDFVQEGAPMEVPMARERVPAMQEMVATCRESGIPVIYTQHILFDDFEVSPLESAYNPKLRTVGMRSGSHGAEVIDELKPHPGDVVFQKHRYDAFHNTRLKSILSTIKGLNTIDTVIIVGTLTEVCCESTARSAYMNDYKVAFISDATGALSEFAQEATLNAIRTFFGRVTSVAEFTNEVQS